MAFQPVDTLKNRTFIGLIVAQFLAGFNDQAIHAAAMFYAIHQGILTEAQAISLMPILFYAPWAIFCTLSGYLADRFSKRHALVIWKVAEVGIALVAVAGFWMGSQQHNPNGAWVVLATVFMMGTHAAFFAPAKYGAMPEILQPHVLSRGNGILESTTFLAAILGTVAGGLLSKAFRDQETFIGIILLALALIGAAASFIIAYLPPANPSRPFPVNLFKPLFHNLGVLFRSRPLSLAVVGIAFFIFMVAYMRATMYMHGQTRNPHWDEFKTSLVVATVALGVGLGSPLAGYFSGGKIELGLVPLGCLGMIAATLFAAVNIEHTAALIGGLVVIGFFSGFYMVPLYTLLQHRAPKTSKGDLVATSNFINVMGAMAASLLFYLLVLGSQLTGITPRIPQEDNVAAGTIVHLKREQGHLVEVVIDPPTGMSRTFYAKSAEDGLLEALLKVWDEPDEEFDVIEFEDGLFQAVGSALHEGDEVIVSRHTVNRVTHYAIRPASQPLRPVYDTEGLPRYLFVGAGLMTMGILVLLCRKLPDFFVRTLFWLRSIGRYRIRVVGMHNLPTQGPVILATNCERLDSCLEVVTATDRFTRFILVEDPAHQHGERLLRFLARQTTLIAPVDALADADRALQSENLLAVTADAKASTEVGKWWPQLVSLPSRSEGKSPIVPVYCGPLHPEAADGHDKRIRVVFGHALPANARLDEVRASIRRLGEWIRASETNGHLPPNAVIPGASNASRTEMVSGHPPHP
jgi:MFS family permease